MKRIVLSLLLGSTLALGACTLPPWDIDPNMPTPTTGPEEGVEEMEKEMEAIEGVDEPD